MVVITEKPLFVKQEENLYQIRIFKSCKRACARSPGGDDAAAAAAAAATAAAFPPASNISPFFTGAGGAVLGLRK